MIWLILIIGFILRIINLNQSLWLDEATQAILSSDSLYSILFRHGADFHPPLSYILMHFWISFSKSEIWLRLLSVIFGVATIWSTYLISTKLFNKKIGLLSSFFLAIAPFHIYYSQEVRMYAQAAFFAALSMYFFQSWIVEKKLKYSTGYILATTALLYTHYDGFFLILTQILFIIFKRFERFKSFACSLFLVFLLWLPWLPQFLIQLKGGLNIDQYLPGWRGVLSLDPYKAIPLTFLKFSIGRIDFDNKLLYLLLAILVLSIFSYPLILGIKKIKNTNLKLIIYWLFIPIISSFLISFKLPINQPFRLLYTLPAFYILISLGLVNLGKHKQIMTGMIIVTSVCSVLLYQLNPKYWREDWKDATKFVMKNANENSLIVFAWPDPFPPYRWYGGDNNALGVVPNFPAKKQDVENILKLIDQKKEVFFFEYLQQLADPNKYVQVILEEKGFKQDKIYNFRGVGFIYHYAKS